MIESRTEQERERASYTRVIGEQDGTGERERERERESYTRVIGEQNESEREREREREIVQCSYGICVRVRVCV